MKFTSRIPLITTFVLCLYVVYSNSGEIPLSNRSDLVSKTYNFLKHKDLQQKLLSSFCSLFHQSSIPGFRVSFEGIQTVYSPRFDLNYSVYAESDIVSVAIAEGGWETSLVEQAVKALDLVSKSKTIPNPIFLDVGANVGYFSLSVASRGYEVIGFEPMAENALLIKKSICENPILDQKITLFNKGLGTEEETCWLFSDPGNTGDGHVHCKTKPNTDYIIRGLIETVRLDDYIDDPNVRSQIGVVKMDVEGYEHNVLRGGTQVLLSGSIPFIQTEYSRDMMPSKGGNLTEFLQSFFDAGYLAKDSFFTRGDGYTADEIMKGKMNEIFFVHRSVDFVE